MFNIEIIKINYPVKRYFTLLNAHCSHWYVEYDYNIL